MRSKQEGPLNTSMFSGPSLCRARGGAGAPLYCTSGNASQLSERFIVQTIGRKRQNGPLREFPERFTVQGTSLNTQSFREFERNAKTGARASSLNDESFRELP